MSAPKTRLDHTPHYDAWVAELRVKLAPRGRKTALAHHMAAERSQSYGTWSAKITRILAGQIINAEDLLTIIEWMDGLPDA